MADGKVRIPSELLASVPMALAHQPQTAGQCLGAVCPVRSSRPEPATGPRKDLEEGSPCVPGHLLPETRLSART